ncbi:GM14350 [Drosophila sechellia]|uniref:DNA repair protein REV1 n=1 Tax=Drosophila sechellia TaxID=7238 RepID=B4HVI1_DROSE|nr:GM14350 [Drosophila sechellia]
MTRDEDNGFSEWGGYFEAKKSKLEEQFAAASDPFRKSDLFEGISIYVNGRTDPSADELKRIMMVHGGTFHHYERSHTTYIIASVLPDVKVRNMNLSKFISAKWVVDCLEKKKIVDYKPYLLYTNQKTSQPRLMFGKPKDNDANDSKSDVEPFGGAEMEVDSTNDETQMELGGILKHLHQAVATSPEKEDSASENKITNLSTTSNNSTTARTAADPNFLSEFYKNSRLHHIATLGTGFKQELTDLVDELNVDVMAFVSHIRQEVYSKTGCTCSAGVASNKLLARMATKEAKPNGQLLLDSKNDILAYMAPMSLDLLPGVGSSMSHKLKQAGLNNCGDVQKTTLGRLERVLGKKLGQNLFQNCRGIDDRPLAYEQARKTVSAEMNFGIRFTNSAECEQFLCQLSHEVTKRLVEIKRKARSVNLKIMVRAAEAPVETSKYMGHGVCDTINKSSLIKHATDDVNVITTVVLNLMKEADIPPHELRGLGIHLTRLEDASAVRKENIIKQMFGKMSEMKKDKPIPQEAVGGIAVGGAVGDDKVKKPSMFENKPKPREPRNVFSMLTAAAVSRKSVNEDRSQRGTAKPITRPLSPVPKLDEDVLAQLPEDIRLEVIANREEHLCIAEYDGNRSPQYPALQSPPLLNPSVSTNLSPLKATDLKPSTSRAAVAKLQKRKERKEQEHYIRSDHIVADYIEDMPDFVHPHILKLISHPVTEVPEVPELLMGDKYKDLLNKWVSREEAPSPNDVDLFLKHVSRMIRNDQLDHMCDVMKYLCRIINMKRSCSCCWHMAYKHIEEVIQNQMLTIEGYNLLFIEYIRCRKCS